MEKAVNRWDRLQNDIECLVSWQGLFPLFSLQQFTMSRRDPIASIRKGLELMQVVDPGMDLEVGGAKRNRGGYGWEYNDRVTLLPNSTYLLERTEDPGTHPIQFDSISQVIAYFRNERAPLLQHVTLTRVVHHDYGSASNSNSNNNAHLVEHQRVVLYETEFDHIHYDLDIMPTMLEEVRLRPPGILRETGLHVPITTAGVNYLAARNHFNNMVRSQRNNRNKKGNQSSRNRNRRN